MILFLTLILVPVALFAAFRQILGLCRMCRPMPAELEWDGLHFDDSSTN